MFLAGILNFFINLIFAVFESALIDYNLWAIIPAAIIGIILFVLFVILQRQPTQPAKLIIKVSNYNNF